MMGTEKRQILVVDDVELNRAILAELFQDSYEVLEAETAVRRWNCWKRTMMIS